MNLSVKRSLSPMLWSFGMLQTRAMAPRGMSGMSSDMTVWVRAMLLR